MNGVDRRSGRGEGQPSASDLLGLTEDGAYANHLRREFSEEREPSGEDHDEQEDQEPTSEQDPNYVEITCRYVLYSDGKVLQADSLRRLAVKILRMRLGKLILGD